MHTCSGIYHKLSFLRFYCGRGRQKPLIGSRIECSSVLFLKLANIFGKSPRVSAGASLLSFNLFLEILKFHSVGTALMRKFDLYFTERWYFCVLGCLRDAVQPLCIVLVELLPRLLCSSVKSVKIPAALCREIHNQTVAHLSL